MPTVITLSPNSKAKSAPTWFSAGKKMLNWSLNNYLGLANHPEVRKADAEGAAEFGMAAPMGARMMSGQTVYHEQLERELAAFVGKEDAFLLNFGYQGMISIIDCLLTPPRRGRLRRRGARLHHRRTAPAQGQAVRVSATTTWSRCACSCNTPRNLAEEQNGGVLVITEGVFGMKGDLGKLDEIVALKKDFHVPPAGGRRATASARWAPGGRGTASHFGVVDGVDVLFNTFAKSMAGIGAFVAVREVR